MKYIDLLSGNHDIHMHSRDFSDGAHNVLDLVRFTARWQKDPRWVGLSDHSPRKNRDVCLYIDKMRGFQAEASNLDGITLLAGMELDWKAERPEAGGLSLAGLDYVLAAYHKMSFSTAEQVEKHYHLVARHPYTDAAAHPDRFLGEVDPLAVSWECIFNEFAHFQVICEYNLVTPLHPDILEIAIHLTEVNFIIGSDTHDFRNIAARRVIDAWSEMMGGGFELAYEYLTGLLKLSCSVHQTQTLSRLFATRQLLEDFQSRIYQVTLDPGKAAEQISPEESLLMKILADIPECDADKDFLVRRLERFTNLLPERIISLQDVEEFRKTVNYGRSKRIEIAGS